MDLKGRAARHDPGEARLENAVVVIPTRDRSDMIGRAVSSVLEGGGPLQRLLVVDQSRDGRTRAALSAFTADSRLEYLPMQATGIAVALNYGISAADSELIAITNDDCEAQPEWLANMVAAISAEPDIAIAFGSVVPPRQWDSAAGFVQSYQIQRPAIARGWRGRFQIGGMTCNLGIRRSAWQGIGGFDPLLGVGAPLQSAEETDFLIRSLRAGYAVSNAPASVVVHHSFLPWSARAQLIDRNWFGNGASLAKLLRLDPAAGMLAGLSMALSWLGGSSHVTESLGRGPIRGRQLRAFTRGFAAGMRQPLDRGRGVFAQA